MLSVIPALLQPFTYYEEMRVLKPQSVSDEKKTIHRGCNLNGSFTEILSSY